MKKILSLLLLFLLALLLLSGAASWFRDRADELPAPLRPAFAWINQIKSTGASDWDSWLARLTGRPRPLVASDTAGPRTKPVPSAQPLPQVTPGHNGVATVQVNPDGSTAISGAGELTNRASTRAPDTLLSAPDNLRSKELELIAQTDAAIARADAELARVLAGGVAKGGTATPTQAKKPSTKSPNEAPEALPAAVVSASGAAAPVSATTLAPAGPAIGAATTPAPLAAAAAVQSTAGSAASRESSGASQAPTTARPEATRIAMAKPGFLPAAPPLSADVPPGLLLSPDAPLPPAPVTVDGRLQQDTIAHFLSGEVVEFELGRAALTARGQKTLLSLLDIIERHQNTLITVQGHTDSIGDAASNLALSTARAIAARAFLIDRGVEPGRLRVQGFGERRPVASNQSVSGRIKNRRIDFRVSDR